MSDGRASGNPAAAVAAGTEAPTPRGPRAGVPGPAALRDELEALVIGDLLGPAGGEHETLPGDQPVHDRYLVGMLAPTGTVAVDPERADGAAVEGDTGPVDDPSLDDATAAHPRLFPSSIGLSCALAPETTEVEVTAEWGRYEKVPDPEGEGTRWQRHPVRGTVRIPLTEGMLGPLTPVPDQPEVAVRGRTGRTATGAWLLTVFLVNGQTERRTNRDEAWLFQARLELAAPDGSPVFLGRREATPIPDPTTDEEDAHLDLLYRHRIEFAVGHGVGVRVEVDRADPRRARRVETAVIPTASVPDTLAPRADDPEFSPAVRALLGRVTLDMERLAHTEGPELRAGLLPLAEAYEHWIGEQQARLDDPGAFLTPHRDTAAAALAAARATAARLRAGIDTVTPNPADPSAYDPDAAEAFRFANAAMWRQRVHTMASAARRADPELGVEEAEARFTGAEHHSWRPFQLAFLLVNVPALTRPTHPDRVGDGLVDLLFFPTGGGKTEAYLGLAAFTLAIRRLQGTVAGHDGRAGGVGVLMRYTLRLLTAQQFQRAAALICACELARRDATDRGDDRYGTTPFRLGMWVGSNVTPNTNIDATKVVEQARGAGSRGRVASPLQLTHCPWCGSPLDPGRDVQADRDRWRTLVYCSDPLGRCPFTGVHSPGEGIPVVTVDDELYRLLPDFLVATADKFAQLPWKGPVHLLFGRTRQRCTRHGYRSPDLDVTNDREERDEHRATQQLPAAKTEPCPPLRPPDLVIQDELHLISGPLGTLVGLYETAIDDLASWEVDGRVVRPKVVASTATVRRAGRQVHALFARRLAVFPPPVLDAPHAFFAEQRPVSAEHPGRRYLGICAPGQRLKAAEVRVFTTLLAAAQRLYDRYGALADPWMTLVCYFGSLRELGGAKRLVDDDVRARLRAAKERGLGDRRVRSVEELTSRIASTEIPQVLARLEQPFGSRPDGDGKAGTTGGVDVVLATNMISVGVDVSRLGLMCCVGQPKATAEYIQATSRVGRSTEGPGLVVTLFNWARPRDLSHYETFEHYHATFYRRVEALSVTPFAARALDRGLTAVFTSLVRHAGDPDWNANLAAGAVDLDSPAVDRCCSVVTRRAAEVTSDAAVEREVAEMLAARRDAWRAEQGTVGAQLGYKQATGTIRGLLHEPTQGTWDQFTCPNSLRETEPTVNLIITRWEPDPAAEAGPRYELGAGEPRARGRPGMPEDDEPSPVPDDEPAATAGAGA